MGAKERIEEATISLLEHRDPDDVTVRDICAAAEASLGLVNYHFGSRKKLIEVCVQKIINSIVERFVEIRNDTQTCSPQETIIRLGDMTFTFLFEHAPLARISIVGDMREPASDDNTQRTIEAFRPLVRACRPALSEDEISAKTSALIAAMQSAFMRSTVIRKEEGIDLRIPAARSAYHRRMLQTLGILEETE